MDNNKKSTLQEAKANFEEIKNFAREAARKELENEVNEKVDKILKESLSIEVGDNGDVTIEKDDKVVEIQKNEEGSTEVEVESLLDHKGEEEEIEIDENLEEMITFEQEEFAPQQGEMPVEAPIETPEAPVDDMPEAPVDDMQQPEGVEQIAQSLASEIIKLVQTASGEASDGAPEVVIDDEQDINAEMPVEPAPAPVEQPVQEEDEFFEVSLEEENEENEESDEIFEISLEEIEGAENDEEYFNVDPEDEGEIEAMLKAVGDIGNTDKNWKKEAPNLDIPKVGDELDIEEFELDEVKMMGQSNTVQKTAGTSVGPELAVKNRNRQTSSMPVNENKVHNESKADELTKENKRLNESLKEMKSVIKDYQSSFKDLRKQFDEMQTFNAKLAYANKIFANGGLSTENKARIAEQFDKTQTVDEAKNLYDNIIKENKISVNENVKKIKAPTTNNVKSKNTFYESKDMTRRKVLAGIQKAEEI